MDAGLFWVLIIIGGLLYAVYRSHRMQQANNAALGVAKERVYRYGPVNFLGGYPGAEAGDTVMFVGTPRELALESVTAGAKQGGNFVMRLPMSRVHDLLVETEEEAKQRLTVTRMLTLGVFSLAFPKKTKGSVLITIDSVRGPVVLENPKAGKADVLRQLGPIIALARQHGKGRRPAEPAPDATRNAHNDGGTIDVADQLKKLAALRKQGILTDEEFDSEKRKLLDR